MAPLGLDPKFASFNFEIRATLKPGSDPKLCDEGQRVKATFTRMDGTPAQDKLACTQGRNLANCRVHADCDTRMCVAGIRNGLACDTIEDTHACLIGGGSCRGVANTGRCTPFPFNPPEAPRGNDDYERDFTGKGNDPPKLHGPDAASITWVDFPGAAERPGLDRPPYSFKYQGDFLAFVQAKDGSMKCSCHFQITINYDRATNMYKEGSELTKIDAESMTCTPQ